MHWSRIRFQFGLCLGIAAVLAWQYLPRPTPPMPPAEAGFVAAVEDARTAWLTAPNDLARVNMRAARAAAICAGLPALTATAWRATVQNVTPNLLPDIAGKATAQITLTLNPHITLSTPSSPFNNPAAMVEAGSPLYALAATLRPGTPVVVSATFSSSDTDCADEESLTPNGSMTAPVFKIQIIKLEK